MTREELFRAVGEVREDQITEAETKRKSRPWRRYGLLTAACLALAVTAVSAAPWIREQPQWKSIIGSFNPAVQIEQSDGGDLDGSDYRTDGETRPAAHYSTGVEIGELAGPGNGEGNMAAASCLAWLSPEEILARDSEIFRGTVRSLRYFQVDMGGFGGFYYTVANVEVTDPIRSGLEAGKTCTVLYPGARGYLTTSISGPLEDLDVGDEAIFMPIRTDEETGWQEGGSYFCYADLGEFYLSEGLRFVFADTEDGLEFERGVYEEIAEAETLDEVAAYLREMLERETAQPAAAPGETAPEIDPSLADPSYFPEDPAKAGEE